ncbi:hypothetical protein [Sphingomonas metalli]|nr:hypothetical protein [Sphingomonas metalli]
MPVEPQKPRVPTASGDNGGARDRASATPTLQAIVDDMAVDDAVPAGFPNMKSLNDRFVSEPRTKAGAAAEVALMKALEEQQGAKPAYKPLFVECRATLCRVAGKLDDEADFANVDAASKWLQRHSADDWRPLGLGGPRGVGFGPGKTTTGNLFLGFYPIIPGQ